MAEKFSFLSKLPSGIWVLLGTIIGGIIGHFTQKLQIKYQEKRERRREIIEAYKLAIDSICTYLDVIQQEFVEDIVDKKDWEARERLARIAHWRSVGYLRMLGENEIAENLVRFMDYLEGMDRDKLEQEWERMLNNFAYPLLEKINQRLRKL
jgi:uncharacterized membrane protein YheB (UPF0754 family)